MRRSLTITLHWLNLVYWISQVSVSVRYVCRSSGRCSGPEARTLLLSLVAVAALHAVFNLWRHTALMDGALRRITPRAIHHTL
ncbi:MAG: hypothetical protein R6V26_13030 [Roseovarius sp.]